MKYISVKNHILQFTVFLITGVLLLSCKNDDDKPAVAKYPKEVTIEYKVTSSTGLKIGNILFTNETGGNTTLDDQDIPFSKKFKRTVNQIDVVALSYDNNAAGTAKLEIIVDDKVVESQTFESTSFVNGSIVYLFQ
ncbi:MAG: hypothetical protein M3512_11925 [Bacteroidota bacterium]|nr:hypothetical protein [Bacteroidota bacterium]